MKYYHVSTRRLRVGTKLLKPSELRAQGMSTTFDFKYDKDRDHVYIHAHVVPHYTMQEIGKERLRKAHVYEVMPLSDVTYSDGWDELLCESAVITKYVGNAWGIANNIPYTNDAHYKSMTRYDDIESTKLVKVKGRGKYKERAQPIKINMSVSVSEIREISARNSSGRAYISNRKFSRLYNNILEDKQYIGWDEIEKLKAKKARLIAKLGNKSK